MTGSSTIHIINLILSRRGEKQIPQIDLQCTPGEKAYWDFHVLYVAVMLLGIFGVQSFVRSSSDLSTVSYSHWPFSLALRCAQVIQCLQYFFSCINLAKD
jgi:hypothetical protein